MFAHYLSVTVDCWCAAQGSKVEEWQEVLSGAQQCDQLARRRKPVRKLMLHIYGGHTAYHDAKAHTRLTLAYKVYTFRPPARRPVRHLNCSSPT